MAIVLDVFHFQSVVSVLSNQHSIWNEINLYPLTGMAHIYYAEVKGFSGRLFSLFSQQPTMGSFLRQFSLVLDVIDCVTIICEKLP